MTEVSETELNESLSFILDHERTAIPTKLGALTLRDILSAVHYAQQTDTRWITKLIGKKKFCPKNIILHLPDKIGEYINLTEGGQYLGFYNQIVDSLDLLGAIGLLDVLALWEYNDEEDEFEAVSRYGVSTLGKAFVKYRENQKS